MDPPPTVAAREPSSTRLLQLATVRASQQPQPGTRVDAAPPLPRWGLIAITSSRNSSPIVRAFSSAASPSLVAFLATRARVLRHRSMARAKAPLRHRRGFRRQGARGFPATAAAVVKARRGARDRRARALRPCARAGSWRWPRRETTKYFWRSAWSLTFLGGSSARSGPLVERHSLARLVQPTGRDASNRSTHRSRITGHARLDAAEAGVARASGAFSASLHDASLAGSDTAWSGWSRSPDRR